MIAPLRCGPALKAKPIGFLTKFSRAAPARAQPTSAVIRAPQRYCLTDCFRSAGSLRNWVGPMAHGWNYRISQVNFPPATSPTELSAAVQHEVADRSAEDANCVSPAGATPTLMTSVPPGFGRRLPTPTSAHTSRGRVAPGTPASMLFKVDHKDVPLDEGEQEPRGSDDRLPCHD